MLSLQFNLVGSVGRKTGTPGQAHTLKRAALVGKASASRRAISFR